MAESRRIGPRFTSQNVGTSEAFIEAFSGELLEVADASSIHGAERDALKNAIMTVLLEGLMPAFEHLKRIRTSIASPLPELNRRQLYEDFARGLWHAYKDLFPKAVLLAGFEVGFPFKKEADFEKESAKFMDKVPSLILDVPEFVRWQRANWQQGPAGFRNDYLEHRKASSQMWQATISREQRKCFLSTFGERCMNCFRPF